MIATSVSSLLVLIGLGIADAALLVMVAILGLMYRSMAHQNDTLGAMVAGKPGVPQKSIIGMNREQLRAHGLRR